MELWIRSQDRKSLIKTTIVKYDRDYSNKAIIQGATNEDNWYTELGKYKNKERAIEVLNEIQNLIQPPVNFIVSYNTIYNTIKEEPKIEKISDVIVYEMPKE